MVPEILNVKEIFFWTIFCPFNPPNNPKYQNFEKTKETPGGIIILHICTKNDNHVMYGS